MGMYDKARLRWSMNTQMVVAGESFALSTGEKLEAVREQIDDVRKELDLKIGGIGNRVDELRRDVEGIRKEVTGRVEARAASWKSSWRRRAQASRARSTPCAQT
jgi:hypothetical protein